MNAEKTNRQTIEVDNDATTPSREPQSVPISKKQTGLPTLLRTQLPTNTRQRAEEALAPEPLAESSHSLHSPSSLPTNKRQRAEEASAPKPLTESSHSLHSPSSLPTNKRQRVEEASAPKPLAESSHRSHSPGSLTDMCYQPGTQAFYQPVLPPQYSYQSSDHPVELGMSLDFGFIEPDWDEWSPYVDRYKNHVQNGVTLPQS